MEKKSTLTDTLKKVKDKVSGLLKWVKWLLGFPNWLRKHWKGVVLVGVFATGLAMMFGASFRLRGTELIAVLAIGGMLIASAYVKMAFDSAVERARRAQESDDLRNENIEFLEESTRLKNELEEERGKRVKVLGIRLISEIGILEAECEVTKFFDCYFDKDDQEILEEIEAESEKKGAVQREKVKRFVGALTTKFKARYGIEMVKVQMKRVDEAKTIHVAGAEPSFLGVRRYPQMRWEGTVGLCRGWLDEWKTSVDSRKLESKCRERYREDLVKSLENGPEQLEWVKGPLRKNIEILLKEMIAPPGYSVKLVENADDSFIQLSEDMRKLRLEGPD